MPLPDLKFNQQTPTSAYYIEKVREKIEFNKSIISSKEKVIEEQKQFPKKEKLIKTPVLQEENGK